MTVDMVKTPGTWEQECKTAEGGKCRCPGVKKALGHLVEFEVDNIITGDKKDSIDYSKKQKYILKGFGVNYHTQLVTLL